MSDVELGIIEGYYGREWGWQEREETIAFLAGYGYRFYLYAPKADPYLRRLWREPHPADLATRLAALGERCRAIGVKFGLGVSPTRTQFGFDNDAREALARKLAFMDELGADHVAILFDDIRGDVPDLAERQAEVVYWATGRIGGKRLLVCPSYYTDDPVIDRVFGKRPDRYLERLGAMIDPDVDLFWTGEEVCSRELSPGHLRRVSSQLGRTPFLWDNYPVNDGERMSQFLHLRAFTGRPAANSAEIAGHGINPALQPTLTRIPAITLAESYRLGDEYQYGVALRKAAIAVLGEELGRMVHEDVLQLQDIGLDRLGDKAATLRARYGAIDHPGAREIIDWLDGGYRITDAIIRAQSGEDTEDSEVHREHTA